MCVNYVVIDRRIGTYRSQESCRLLHTSDGRIPFKNKNKYEAVIDYMIGKERIGLAVAFGAVHSRKRLEC